MEIHPSIKVTVRTELHSLSSSTPSKRFHNTISQGRSHIIYLHTRATMKHFATILPILAVLPACLAGPGSQYPRQKTCDGCVMKTTPPLRTNTLQTDVSPGHREKQRQFQNSPQHGPQGAAGSKAKVSRRSTEDSFDLLARDPLDVVDGARGDVLTVLAARDLGLLSDAGVAEVVARLAAREE